jgi:hypothetical protein
MKENQGITPVEFPACPPVERDGLEEAVDYKGPR